MKKTTTTLAAFAVGLASQQFAFAEPQRSTVRAQIAQPSPSPNPNAAYLADFNLIADAAKAMTLPQSDLSGVNRFKKIAERTLEDMAHRLIKEAGLKDDKGKPIPTKGRVRFKDIVNNIPQTDPRHGLLENLRIATSGLGGIHDTAGITTYANGALFALGASVYQLNPAAAPIPARSPVNRPATSVPAPAPGTNRPIAPLSPARPPSRDLHQQLETDYYNGLRTQYRRTHARLPADAVIVLYDIQRQRASHSNPAVFARLVSDAYRAQHRVPLHVPVVAVGFDPRERDAYVRRREAEIGRGSARELPLPRSYPPNNAQPPSYPPPSNLPEGQRRYDAYGQEIPVKPQPHSGTAVPPSDSGVIQPRPGPPLLSPSLPPGTAAPARGRGSRSLSMPPPSGVTTVPVQPHIAEPLLTETRPTEGNFVRFLGDFNDKIKEAHDRTLRLIRESHTAAESAGALEHFLLAADTVVRGMGEVLFMKYPKTAEGKPIVVSGEDPINFKAIDASGIPKTGRYRELLEGLILASEKMAATKESLAKNNPMTPAACEKALEDLYYPAFESLDMTIQMLAKETTQGIAPPAPPQTRPTRPNGELTQEERVKREDSILTFQTFNDAIKRAYDMAFNFIHGSFLARHGDTPETTRIRKEKAAADSAAALMRFLGNVDTGVQNMGWELAGMYQLKTTDGRPIPATPKSDSDRIDFSKVDMRGIPATDQYRRLLYELIKADGKLTLTKGTAERLAADDKMDPDVKRLACERELRDLYAGTFEPIGITVQGLNPNEPLPKVDPPSPAAGRGQAQLKAPPANRNRAAGKVVDHKAMLCAQIYSFSPRPVSYVRRA